MALRIGAPCGIVFAIMVFINSIYYNTHYCVTDFSNLQKVCDASRVSIIGSHSTLLYTQMKQKEVMITVRGETKKFVGRPRTWSTRLLGLCLRDGHEARPTYSPSGICPGKEENGGQVLTFCLETSSRDCYNPGRR